MPASEVALRISMITSLVVIVAAVVVIAHVHDQYSSIRRSRSKNIRSFRVGEATYAKGESQHKSCQRTQLLAVIKLSIESFDGSKKESERERGR